ncbi:MAG: extracellular solute-binding protein [Halobacteria archaeon]|nr:extracellular solute-binding protein [Halobacteria archaeon]
MEGANRGITRRTFLRLTAPLIGALAGCIGGTTSGNTVSILAAGSLQNAFINSLEPNTDVPIRVEAYGSARAARMVAEGQRNPDIVALADTALFEGLLKTWYAVFATNSMVLAYNLNTRGGRRVKEADEWFAPLVEGNAELGRTDPDLDPLGYRTLFTLELADDYYDRTLSDKILSENQIYPETQLLAQFDTGSIDAAFVYRSMAIERDYGYIELPDPINLSTPKYANRYSETSYTLPDGTVVHGGVIRYGANVRHISKNTITVFQNIVSSNRYLEKHGFVVPKEYPEYTGDVPDEIRN